MLNALCDLPLFEQAEIEPDDQESPANGCDGMRAVLSSVGAERGKRCADYEEWHIGNVWVRLFWKYENPYWCNGEYLGQATRLGLKILQMVITSGASASSADPAAPHDRAGDEPR